MNTIDSIHTDEIIIESLTVGPIQTNIFLVGCPATGEAAVIDGGGEAQRLVELADEHDLEIEQILQTHAHIDHVAGLEELKELVDAPILLHEDELQLYEVAPQQGQMFGFDIDPLPPVDGHIEANQTIRIGELEATVRVYPGHSPGGVAFWFEDQEIMISGDVLFQGSIGRIDLPGSSREAMQDSLERLMQLPDELQILPGHGPATTIGHERRNNPYLNSSR